MRIPSGRDFFLRHFPPFVLCAALVYLPYFFFRGSDLFMISLKYGALEHALYGLVPVGIILFPAWLGARGAPQEARMYYFTSQTVRLGLWTLLLASGVAQVAQLLLAASGFLSGGYLVARDSSNIEGIGVIIRLDIILLPVLAAVSRSKRNVLRIFLLLSVFHVARAVLMSERVAIIETLCIAWVLLPLCGIYSVSLKKALVVVAVVSVMFSFLLQSRLDEQSQLGSKFDSSSTSFLDSVSAYYADTTNKYYQVADGDFRYPGIYALSPVLALIGGESDRAAQYKNLLASLEGSTFFVSKGLNNPGGLAQDISDFGWIGYFVIFFKFTMLSFMWRRRFRGVFFTACAPLVLIAVLEYPRFNYLYMPFAAYLFVIALGIGFVLTKISRPAQPATGRIEPCQQP